MASSAAGADAACAGSDSIGQPAGLAVAFSAPKALFAVYLQATSKFFAS
jgi:hypothetical protein